MEPEHKETSMDAQEKMIQKQVALYRGRKAMSLVRALGLTAVGVAAIAYSMTTVSDWSSRPEATGWLYTNLGRDGTILTVFGVSALMTLSGLIWFLRIVRDLRAGAKAYEEQLREEMRSNSAQGIYIEYR
jgi:hypothetical protein